MQEGYKKGKVTLRIIYTAKYSKQNFNLKPSIGLSIIGYNSLTPTQRSHTGIRHVYQQTSHKVMDNKIKKKGVIRVRKNERLSKDWNLRHRNVINAQNLMTRLPDYFAEVVKTHPARCSHSEFKEVQTENKVTEVRKREKKEDQEVKMQVTEKKTIRRNDKRRIIISKEKDKVITNEDSLNLSNIKEVNKIENDSFEIKTDIMKLLKQ